MAEPLRRLAAVPSPSRVLRDYSRSRNWRAATTATTGGHPSLAGPQTEQALRLAALIPNRLATWAFGLIATTISSNA